jgi:DNA-binding SARP family transcriptional activator
MTNSRKAPSKSVITLHALGSCVIQTPRERLTPNHEVVFAAALYLFLERGIRVESTTLENLLWTELANSDYAHHRLRQTLLKMRQLGMPLQKEPRALILPIAAVRTDFDKFTEDSDSENGDPECCELFKGYLPKLSASYSHWFDTKHREIAANIIRHLLKRLARARAGGQWNRVDALASRCLELDEFNEEAVLARAEAAAMRGAKVDALQILDQYASELGSDAMDLRLPASLMRQRISENTADGAYLGEVQFVTRENELEFLNASLLPIREFGGQIAVLDGAVGIGKTRIANEFARFADLQGFQVRISQCQAGDLERPLALITDLIPALRSLRGAIGCSEESFEILTRVTTQGAAVERKLISADPELLLEALRSALLDLLDAVTEEDPVLIIVDDAHWVDSSSAFLLQQVAGWIKQKKLCLVFISRSPCPPWLSREKFPLRRHREIERLSPHQSHKLINLLISRSERVAEKNLIEWFVSIGDGNPFFLHELVKQWAETGTQATIPDSVNAVIDDRISRLSAEALQILQACALLGKYSTLARLEKVLEYKPYELLRYVEELGQASMLGVYAAASATGAARCSSRHELISDAACRRMSTVTAYLMHRRIGLILDEEANQDASAAIYWDSAEHWARSGDNKHAFELARTYATRLLQVGLAAESAIGYRKAVSYSSSPIELSQILPELAEALHQAGAWQEMSGVLQKLTDVMQQLEPKRNVHSDSELLLFEAYWRSSEQWSELLERIKPCVFDTGADPNHRIRAATIAMKLATNVTLGEELDAIYEAVHPLLNEPSINPRERLHLEMVYNIDRGNMELGRNAALHLVAFEVAEGSPVSLVRAQSNAAQALRRCGEHENAITLLKDSYDICVANHLLSRAGSAAFQLVLVSLEVDDTHNAETWYGVAKEFPVPPEDKHNLRAHRYYGARIALCQGRARDAARIFGRLTDADRKDQSLLHRISSFAIATRIAVALSRPKTHVADLVRSLSALFEIESSRGGQDYEAFSLFLGLSYLGQQENACRMLCEYLRTQRREKGRLPNELKDFAIQSDIAKH